MLGGTAALAAEAGTVFGRAPARREGRDERGG
ncbi:hypothetical protein J2X81_000491 [Sinomonas atrocyanea]|jgi:hypothetical protein|nr:hypothetical protein [Sinomonas atrocyanea]